MNIPKRLMIGSVPYDVEVVNGWIEEFENGDVTMGEARYFKQQIVISDQLEGAQAAQKTLLHESVHAMLHEAGLNHLNKERNVRFLTSILYDFIENNIRGGISSLIGPKEHSYEACTPKENQSGFSFINTAAELVDVVEKYKPQVDVSTLGAALAQAEVQKAVDFGTTYTEMQQAAIVGQTRKLPIISENRGSFPLEDVAKITKKKDAPCTSDQEKKQETADPIHWKTGIKHDEDGTPRYRTRYECPLCGNRGNQYEYKENKFTKCHNCNAKIKIEPATKKGFPDRDAFGNFYVANEEYSEFLEGGQA